MANDKIIELKHINKEFDGKLAVEDFKNQVGL